MLRPSIAVVATCITACLGAASVNFAPAKTQPVATPSQLDYLVLASMADSQRPLSIAAYSASR